jgi:uncharacterized membrane protein YdbT with pleckstrin-like domain
MNYLLSLMSSGETIQMVVRQHWIVMARAIVLNGLAIAVLLLFAGVGTGLDSPAGSVLAAIAALLVIVPLVLLVRSVAWWSARQFVITSRRVMEVSGVLNREVSDSNLDKVNDVVLRQSFLGRALGYGDLQIITGSDVGVDFLPKIRKPMEFHRVMLDNKEDFDALARVGDGAALAREDIPAAIDRLADLHNRGVISDSEFERKKADLLARM